MEGNLVRDVEATYEQIRDQAAQHAADIAAGVLKVTDRDGRDVSEERRAQFAEDAAWAAARLASFKGGCG
ncbi:hypothetical protein [Enterovirga sp. CN4-39]|uniref:hypothetical protein n=1 Tax=Enterovirga sp. CN4-39 TaxID=3400910 RepID=UPI003C114356